MTFAGTQITIASQAAGTLASPAGVALDGKGNVFIADRANNSVLCVPATSAGFGPPSTVLQGLSAPSGVAADWTGNVFVADTGNNRIVMLPVTSTGFAAPVSLGSNLSSPGAVAVDSAGNLYIADSGNNRIVELPFLTSAYGSQLVVATGFNNPMSVAVDAAGNLYIADTGNNRVVKEAISAAGTRTQQIVTYSVVAPQGVAVDKIGNLYIADTGNSRVVEEPWNSGAKRFNSPTIAGSDFVTPQAVAVDWSGNLYVSDSGRNVVQEVLSSFVNFNAVAANSAGSTQTYSFRISAGTAIGAVSIYSQGVSGTEFVDAGDSSCTAQTYAITTLCGVDVAFKPLGSGTRTGAVVLYDTLGNPLATAYLSGIGLAPQAGYLPGAQTPIGTQLSGPSGVAVDGSGNVYIADTGNNRVVEIPWTSSGYGAQVTLSTTGLNSPMGLAVDGAGNLYIVSNGNDKVLKLPWTGNAFGPQVKVGNGLYGPSGVAVDAGGSVYITDTLDNDLDKLPWTGSGYTQAQFLGNYRKFPVGIAVDGNGNVYFAMPYQNTLVKVPWNGSAYLTQLNMPLSGVSFPSAIAVDSNGNLYVLDGGNNRVVMLPWNGTSFGRQITVASGFNAPSGLSVDMQGNLYVADTGNNQVVRINLATPGVIGFDNTYIGSTSADSAETALVENLGNQPFSITEVTYPTDFPESAGTANPCIAGTSISPGASCELGIDFTPVVAGSPLNEAVTVATNLQGTAASQQSVPVTGNSTGRSAQTITFPAISNTVYGAAPPALSATASSGLPVVFQVVSGPAILLSGGSQLSLTGAGVVVVQAMQAGNSMYAAAAPVQQSFNVAPAILTISPTNATAVYGAIPSSFSYTVSGLIAGQSAAQVVTGKPAITAGVAANAGVGTYSLTASQGTLSAANYTFAYATGTLTVTTAVLQVKASALSSAYGAPIPALPWTLTGFVNGDTAAVVAGAPSMSTAASAGSPVGTYAVTPSPGTLSAANYTFTFIAATLHIAPAVLTVTATNQSMVYGAAMPALGYTLAGFVHGDSASNAVSGSPALAAKASAASPVGAYAIVPSQGTLTSSNYTFAFQPGTLSINRAVLTVTPVNATMTYGGSIPALAYAITGLANGDTQASAVSGQPSISASATSASKPGIYPISSAPGTLSARNYTFAFQSGTLTVGKAILTIQPSPATMTYGGSLPSFTYSMQGFVKGDTSNAIQGAPSFTTSASSASPAGTYVVQGAIGTLASPSYAFNVLNGTVSIAKAVLTVQAGSGSMTYGGAMPAFAYSMTGFVNKDSASVVSGKPLFSTGVSRSSPVGIYPVKGLIGTLAAANYSFSFLNGQLKVNPALLTVTASNQSISYGASLPTLSYKITGFVSGDSQQSAVAGSPALTTTASSASAVGQYITTAALGTLSATNYSFQFQPGTLTVNKAKLTVTANNVTMKTGSAVPTLTYTATGYVNGDNAASAVTGAPMETTTASKTAKAGTYPINISQGKMKASNYLLTFVNGIVTVTQ